MKKLRILSEEELKLMNESGYSKKAIELYTNGVNVGELENPSVVTSFLGPCGDLIKLYLKIDKKNIIVDAKFYYLGCPRSATSASAMTMILKGKTIAQAKQITQDDIITELGGLPELKHDCAELSVRTLQKAISEFEKLTGHFEL